MQVIAVDRDVGEAVLRHRQRAKIEKLPRLAGVPQADLFAAGLAGDVHDLLLEAEREQDARSVGADLDAGADLAKLGRLLEDLHVEPLPQEPQRRCQPADATPNDRDFHTWVSPNCPKTMKRCRIDVNFV